MLEEGLSYPFRGETAMGRIFIGGLLGLFSFLIIPAFALFGYLIRVLEYSAKGKDEPPPFDNWGRLIVDGMKGGLILILYGFIPIVLVMITVAVADTIGLSGSIVGPLGGLGILVTIFAVFLLYYLAPAGLTNMVLQDRISAAFEFKTLKRPLLSFNYFAAWILPFVVAFLINIVTVLVVVFTLGFGLLVVPFIQFYFQVTVFYMFGRAFGSVVDIESPQESHTTAPS